MLLKIRKNCIAILAAVLIALLLVVCAVGLAQNGQVAHADSTPSVRIFWGITHSGEFIVSDSSGDISSAGCVDEGSFQADNGSRFDTDVAPVPWEEHLESIQKVSFKGNVVPVSLSYWFAGCYYLREIDFTGLDTSLVQDMGNMFLNCAMLESLDLSSFNTANVTDMEGMFFGCVGLTGAFGKGADASIRISNNFTTANVKQMDKMFHNCYGLTEIDMSTFDIALGNGMTMENMFFDFDNSTPSNFAISKIITPNTIADGVEIMLPTKFYDTVLEADIVDNSESVPKFILTSENQGKHELLIHEEHNYNAATCLKKESCSICGDQQGVLNKNNHDVNCGKIFYWDIDGSELVVSRHWHELASNEEEVGSF
ncbi:MAG: DUF285 domain-containing protein, partial [Clostridia bacterium]|nr:DUF285 domain-containing protein [Clostridia bacterium]